MFPKEQKNEKEWEKGALAMSPGLKRIELICLRLIFRQRQLTWAERQDMMAKVVNTSAFEVRTRFLSDTPLRCGHQMVG